MDLRKILYLSFLPLLIYAQSYYTDEDKNLFSATIKTLSSEVHLDEKGFVEIEVHCPKDFQLHAISHEENQSEFRWETKETVSEKKNEEDQTFCLNLSFDPCLTGQHYLNLPTLHLVSKNDPKCFATLYPPIKAVHVKSCKEDPLQNLKIKETLALDLRRPVEIDDQNQQHVIEQSKKHFQEASLHLTPHFYEKFIKYLVLFIMLGFFLLKFFAWLRKKISFKTIFVKEKDPKELALAELELLKKQMLIQKGFFEEFYVRLTQIVRTYIERKFNVKAPEQTTQEFLEEVLSKKIFHQSLSAHLEEFLKFADLVKFAKLNPLPNECVQAQEAVYSFIETPDQEIENAQV